MFFSLYPKPFFPLLLFFPKSTPEGLEVWNKSFKIESVALCLILKTYFL